MEEYVTFRCGDELFHLPASVVDTPSKLAWFKAYQPKPTPHGDRITTLMLEVYNNHAATNRKILVHKLPFIKERYITGFQFWLRNKLTRWGLI